MESIPESMSFDEKCSPDSGGRGGCPARVGSERRYSRSPQSPCRMSGTPTIRSRTPGGTSVYNPFHRDTTRRLGGFICSPGLFSTPPPARGQDGASQPFAWSPNTKGDLFPEDIDEHPTTQFQLQEQINSQYDEEAQSFIGNFFNSQLVLPSPCESNSTPQSAVASVRARILSSHLGSSDSPMARSSTRQEGATPTGRRPAGRGAAVEEADAAVQTALSLPPGFDLDALLPLEMRTDACEVTRGQPHRPLRSFVCEACNERAEGAARCVRRNLFSPTDDEAGRGPLSRSVQDALHDFNASSPETCAGSVARFNSSFDGADKLVSPDISPIGSPDKTLNNEEAPREPGNNDTFHMDVGYQSSVMLD